LNREKREKRFTVSTKTEKDKGEWVRAIEKAIEGHNKSKFRVSGLLRVTVVEARNLLAKDWGILGFGGSSDPFAVLRIDNQQNNTITISKSLHPIWNSSFAYDISQQSGILFIVLYDEDKLKKDDFLGQAIVTLDNIPTNTDLDLWLPLFPRKEGESVRGRVHVKLNYNYTKEMDTSSNAIFGTPIEELVSRPEICISGVPKFFMNALQFLETYAMDEEGLFRLSGSVEVIKALRKDIDQGKEVDFQKFVKAPHNVTGLVKLFLREFPVPLLTFDSYDDFLDVVSMRDQNEKMNKLSSIIGSLPSSNKEILKVLLPFLGRVSQHSKQNMMTSQNLAIVFGPSFLRPKEETFQTMCNAIIINEVTALLIASWEQFLLNCLL